MNITGIKIRDRMFLIISQNLNHKPELAPPQATEKEKLLSLGKKIDFGFDSINWLISISFASCGF